MPSVSGNVGAVASVSSVFGRNGGVVAANGDYSGVVAAHLTGATAATRYVGGTASGAPVAGTFAVGDFVIEQTGQVYVCTVAGTPGTWAAPGGGLQTALVTLTDAQVKALPTTGIQAVAAPGANTMLVVVSSVWELDATHGAYGNVSDLALGYGTGTATPATDIYVDSANGAFADTSAVHLIGFSGANDSAGKASWFADRAQCAGVALFVIAFSGVGNFTGGNAANSLTVTTKYYLLDI